MKTDLMEFVAVGDIAGRYLELMQIRQHFVDLPIICVGDPNDRGPMSKQVIEFFMNSQDNILIQSNHGHMMVDFLENSTCYEPEVFSMNGGIQTLESYGVPGELLKQLSGRSSYYWYYSYSNHMPKDDLNVLREQVKQYVPKEHVEFLKTRPMYVEGSNFILTHAPIGYNPIPEETNFDNLYSPGVDFLWTRAKPKKMDGKYQIHGHNSIDAPLNYMCNKTGEIYGTNIDTSRGEALTGAHFKDGKIVEYKRIPYYEDLSNGSK